MLINSPNISGSLKVTGNTVITGSLTVLGGINGAITGSATSASYVEYSNVANKPALVSASSQVTYSGLTGIPAGIVSGSSQITGFGIFATTGSNQFNGSQAVTGSLTVTGQVVAQTLNVQQVTSSIVYSSGSNIFGNSLGNTQQFTGSVSVTGSLAVAGAGTFASSVGVGGATSTNGFLEVFKSGGSISQFSIGQNSTYHTDFFVDASGNFYIQPQGNTALTLSNTGAATFSSTINSGDITVNGNNKGLYFNGTRNAILGNASLEEIYLATANATRVTISSTGAATFSSTLQANGNAFILPTLSGGGAGGGLYLGVYPDTQYTKQAILVERYASTLGNYGRGSLHFCNRDTADANQPTLADSRMVITSAGNVGIGTTTPYSKLEVYTTLGASMGVNHAPDSATYPKASGIGLGATSTSYTVASGGGTISFVGGAGMYAENTALSGNPTNLVFWTNLAGTPAERMRITSGGALLVNRSSIVNDTVYKFVVKNSTNVNIGFGIQGGEASIECFNDALSAGTPLRIYGEPLQLYTSGTERMRITSGGDVCIGITSALQPAANRGSLSINGVSSSILSLGVGSATKAYLYTGGTTLTIESSGASADMVFATGNADRLRITSSGILTSLPTYNNTTASAANVQIDSNGYFARSTSSSKYKTDIINYTKGLNEVLGLRPVFYKGKTDGDTQFAGLIAEEVHELGLTEFVQYAPDGSPDALSYQNMIALAFKAIQEQQTQIESLKSKIEILEQS